MDDARVSIVVFDIGNVLIGWDPRRAALALSLLSAISSCAKSEDVGSDASRERDSGGSGVSASPAEDDRNAAARADAANRCMGPCTSSEPRPEPLPRPDCPKDEPEIGQACDRDGLSCGYGDSPSAECRRIYLCESQWRKAPSLASWPCAEVPPEYCPSGEPASGSPCELGLQGSAQPCAYGDVKCYCGPFMAPPDIPRGWGCYGPPSNPECPAELPNVGEGCSQQRTQCNYGVSCYGARENYLLCLDGAWKATGTGACFK